MVSKVRSAPYLLGRGRKWLKSKCSQRQEFMIVGYLSSTASRRMVGSLVLGYYRADRLAHAARVGSGFSESVARDPWERLEALRVTEPPLDDVPAELACRMRWVAPRVVADVKYAVGRPTASRAARCSRAWMMTGQRPTLSRVVCGHLGLDRAARGQLAVEPYAVFGIHSWGAGVNDLDRSDRLVVDLDPGDDVPWIEVIAAAREVRARLKAVGRWARKLRQDVGRQGSSPRSPRPVDP
jgi:hypothetical protein